MRKLCLMAVCGFMIASSPSLVRAQAPAPGQPYQVPAELAGLAPGMQANYGGFNYVIQGDGTMLLAEQPGVSYSSYYVPPTTTYYVGQPVYAPWGGYRPRLAGSRRLGSRRLGSRRPHWSRRFR